ncbi:MAG: PEP-CTERM sorting domain-containing protein [Gammaproteobacteria bacterium]|nr:MAG: PEP-CTERM sorting domain-containing protein [Gammaproteobacteria bacterium]
MRQLLSLLLLPTLFIAINANALLITDTYVYEQKIPQNSWAGHVFELIPAGYSPETDSITHIKLTYDFTEIWSPDNQGDEYQYDDGSYPENPDENSPQYQDEFVIFSSWMFIWREVYGDIDTGLTVFEKDWTRNNSCQFATAAVPGDDDTEYCVYNLDLAGTLNAYVYSASANLWLHSIKLEVEVDRVEVPEPNPILLLGIGLFAIGFLRSRKRV